MDFPEYRRINEQYEVAVLINELLPDKIADTISRLMNDKPLLERLHKNCMEAREVLNWQLEEKKLLEFYQKLLPLE